MRRTKIAEVVRAVVRLFAESEATLRRLPKHMRETPFDNADELMSTELGRSYARQWEAVEAAKRRLRWLTGISLAIDVDDLDENDEQAIIDFIVDRMNWRHQKQHQRWLAAKGKRTKPQ